MNNPIHNRNNTINNGGPAFPVTLDHRGCVGAYGMTLRDWFAGQASEADIEANKGGQIHPQSGRTFNTRSRERAKYAYADAMIAAREVKP